jgi:hypothetical protein
MIVLPTLLAFVPLPSAHAAWTAPVTIDGSGLPPYQRVAIDPSGNAIFVFEKNDSTCCNRVQTRVRFANGTLSPLLYLSPTGVPAGQPAVAVDQSGNAVYVWGQSDGTTDCNGTPCSRIVIRVRFANGSMSAIKTLSDPGEHATYPEVAVDPNGNATATWSRYDGTTDCGGTPGCLRDQGRRRSASGTLGPVVTLSDAGKFGDSFPQVAVDQSGNAIFAIDQPDGSSGCFGPPVGCGRVDTRLLSASGTLSAVQHLSPAGRGAGDGRLGVDQNGNAVFLWSRQDGTTDCTGSGCLRVQDRVRHPDGTLSSVQTLSDAGQDALSANVAVNQGGTAAAVWLRETPSTCDEFGTPCREVQTRVRAAGGTLSAIQSLTSTKPNSDYAHVGIDQSGNAVYVWRANGLGAIRARTRTSSGTLGTTRTISKSGETAYDPVLAVAPTGTAVAAWPSMPGGLEAAFGP